MFNQYFFPRTAKRTVDNEFTKSVARDELNHDVEAFLAAGGTIKTLDTGDSTYLHTQYSSDLKYLQGELKRIVYL